ncbi:hypothetical protein FC36_GL000290 [Ligilactobacillus equi DSM 15833 = JCM 10991]|uniref:Uncharacterized protein n=1 Tax=Ligilactobacillus equi DSM 15833 = JCM 10991 TaxID=1423740 RepID=A0A0R1TSM5_9LACO|nr:hypothetical protein [Ligilactobacillus equi]KRL84367.1 hypothetical protein FC36_GL000290 [Ligilactobacillus equi DSM 15833 = JCM 10991]
MRKFKVPKIHFYVRQNVLQILESGARYTLILFLAFFPTLMVANYLNAISLTVKASNKQLLNTYNLVDLLTRFSVLVLGIVGYKVMTRLKLKKRFTKIILAFLVVIAIVSVYTWVTNNIWNLFNSGMTNLFIYTIYQTLYTFSATGIIFVLSVALKNIITGIQKFRVVKIVLFYLGLVLSLIETGMITFSSHVYGKKEVGEGYVMTHLYRFQLLLLALILSAYVFYGLNKIKQKKTLVYFGVLTLSILGGTISGLFLWKQHILLNYFLLTFFGIVSLIPILKGITSIRFSPKELTNLDLYAPLKNNLKENSIAIALFIASLMGAYLILWLGQLYFAFVTKTFADFTPNMSYLLYFVNSLFSGLAVAIIYLAIKYVRARSQVRVIKHRSLRSAKKFTGYRNLSSNRNSQQQKQKGTQKSSKKPSIKYKNRKKHTKKREK